MSVPGLIDECAYMGEGDWDYYYNEIYWGETRSPLENRCVECECKIPPLKKHDLFIGTKEGSYSGIEDGEVEKIRTCMTCKKMIEEFSNGSRSFGAFWGIFEEITGIWGPDQDPSEMDDDDLTEEEERDRANYLLGRNK